MATASHPDIETNLYAGISAFLHQELARSTVCTMTSHKIFRFFPNQTQSTMYQPVPIAAAAAGSSLEPPLYVNPSFLDIVYEMRGAEK